MKLRGPRIVSGPRPLLHLVPNMFTVMGLCAGLTAIRYALDGRYGLAVMLVIAAAIFDGLDGRAARLLRITSRLGAELDSLADFLSFGVAPAVIVYLWTLNSVRGIGWALALLFATCCALRLARFNSELDEPNKPQWKQYFFTGIPAPAAGLLILTPIMASFVVGEEFFNIWLLNAALVLFVAVMMVSTVPTYSAKKIKVAPQWVVPIMIAAGLLIGFLITEPWLTLSILGLIYLAHIPISVFVARRLRLAEEARQNRAEAAVELDQHRAK